jgi:threonyl-tRNA synthetase
MLVIGDQEVSNRTVALRKRKAGNLGSLKLEEVRDHLLQEINIHG